MIGQPNSLLPQRSQGPLALIEQDPRPGTVFPTIDEAAVAGLDYATTQAAPEGVPERERIGVVVETDGGFTFEEPIPGSRVRATLPWWRIPLGRIGILPRVAATFHTHGPGLTEGFTPQDKQAILDDYGRGLLNVYKGGTYNGPKP